MRTAGAVLLLAAVAALPACSREEPARLPAAAVPSGQQGSYVFVIRADGTAESRPVVIARQVGAQVVLARGVTEGERMVTEGSAA